MRMFDIALAVALATTLYTPASAEADSCAEVGGASFWGGAGWNHVVYVTNRCAQPLACVVATDVDPDQHDVIVQTNETVQVPTAINSSARVFVARVSCDYASAPSTP